MPRLKYLTKHMAYIFLQVSHQFFLFSAQREEYIATRLPRLQKSHKSKTRQVKRTQMVATARFTIRVCFNFFRLLRIERKETVARKDVRFKPEPLPQRLHEEGFTFAQGT